MTQGRGGGRSDRGKGRSSDKGGGGGQLQLHHTFLPRGFPNILGCLLRVFKKVSMSFRMSNI